jgi:hypothetical protein
MQGWSLPPQGGALKIFNICNWLDSIKGGNTETLSRKHEGTKTRKKLDRIYRMNRISKRFGHRCTQMDADLRLDFKLQIAH